MERIVEEKNNGKWIGKISRYKFKLYLNRDFLKQKKSLDSHYK